MKTLLQFIVHVAVGVVATTILGILNWMGIIMSMLCWDSYWITRINVEDDLKRIWKFKK